MAKKRAAYVVAKVKTKMQTESSSKQAFKVIVDSNALFVPFQFKIDIFTELEKLLKRRIDLLLLSAVKDELETLAKKSSPSMRKSATFALTLASKCTYVNVSHTRNEPTDDAIVRVAKAWNVPVFTNDKQLKRKLRDISIPVIYVRAKSRLEIDGSTP